MRYNMSIETMQYENCGSVNEAGYLANIFKKGYTLSQCMSELLANSSDAKSTEVHFEIIRNETIKLIDDGLGMDIQDVDKMYDMNRSNHIGDRSKGVAGIGGKAGQVIAGNKTHVTLFSHKVGCKWLCVNAPWDVIYTEGIYTDQIHKRDMTEDEIQQFKNERPSQSVDGFYDPYHGTTIIFTYNNHLRTAIICGMDKDEDRDGIAADQTTLFGFVFGLDNMKISLSYPDRPDKPIQYCTKYNYFAEDDDSYYCKKNTTDITHWQKNSNGEHVKSRFTYKNTEDANTLMEYPIRATGYAKKETPVTVEELENGGFVNVGTFVYDCGLRKDNDHFNPDSTKELKNIEYVGPYDSGRLVGKNGEMYKYVGYGSMFARNEQVLGSFQYPDNQTSSYRGDKEARHASYVHGMLSYMQVSSQNNPNDSLANIQENKNQWNTVLPTGLTRICHNLRDKKAKEIWIYMNGFIPPTIQVVAAPAEELENVVVAPPPTEEIQVSSALTALQDYTSDDDDATSSSAAGGGSGTNTDEGPDSSSDSEPNAINVISHRRGRVTTVELSEMLLKLNEKILAESNEFYTDENMLKIFNMISAKINTL